MFKKFTIITLVLSVLGTAFLIYDIVDYKNRRTSYSINKGSQITENIKSGIDSILTVVMKEAGKIKSTIRNNKLSENKLEKLIKENSLNNSNILGITVAFQPYEYGKNERLYAPYYDKSSESIIYIEDVYDYTDTSLQTSKWYTDVIEHGSMWTEPYYAEGAKKLVADYGVPFYKSDKDEIAGTVTMTISLDEFTDLIHSLSLGKTGYGFVVSKKGKLLAYPVEQYVGIKDINYLKDHTESEALRRAYSEMNKGVKGFSQFVNEVSGKDTYLFYSPIESTGWKFGVLFFKNELLGRAVELKQKNIEIAFVLGILILSVFILIFKLHRLQKKHIWILSITLSVIIFINILIVWYFQYHLHDSVSKENLPITENAVLERYVSLRNEKAKELKIEQPVVIPTGIFVRNFEFDDAYNVNLSGYIWQKYDTSIVNKVPGGVKFDQASPFAESYYLEKVTDLKQKGERIIGWDFRITFKLNFNYGNYPFDRRSVEIEITHPDKVNNVLLVPDLKGYKISNPSEQPGINPSINIPGNKIISSFFTFSEKTYNTDFGFQQTGRPDKKPVLHYNISIKRNLINSFVSHIIPILVVLLMMYILIYSSTKASDPKKGITSGIGIVESLAAFFFVLIFSHIDLRKTVETTQVMYMEYFYFILYVMLILSVYNLISYTRREDVKLFERHDNLIAKVSYWPLFLIIVYFLTLVNFY